MTSLLFNFFRRAIIVPVVLTVVIVIGAYMTVPKMINDGSQTYKAEDEVVDLSSYNTKDYKGFNELDSGDYVGTIECKNVGMSQMPIVFEKEDKNTVALFKGSKEPWKKGSIAVATTDTKSDLSKLYNAEEGDEVKVDFYANGEYTYKIDRKAVGKTEKDIEKYVKDGRLVICVPYNDFSDLSNSYYYTIYIARKK